MGAGCMHADARMKRVGTHRHGTPCARGARGRVRVGAREVGAHVGTQGCTRDAGAHGRGLCAFRCPLELSHIGTRGCTRMGTHRVGPLGHAARTCVCTCGSRRTPARATPGAYTRPTKSARFGACGLGEHIAPYPRRYRHPYGTRRFPPSPDPPLAARRSALRFLADRRTTAGRDAPLTWTCRQPRTASHCGTACRMQSTVGTEPARRIARSSHTRQRRRRRRRLRLRPDSRTATPPSPSPYPPPPRVATDSRPSRTTAATSPSRSVRVTTAPSPRRTASTP